MKRAAMMMLSVTLTSLVFLYSCGKQEPSTYPQSELNNTAISAELLRGSTRPTLQVAKAGAGSGVVSSSPKGINCGSHCSKSFKPGTTVTLTATPAAGSVFVGWSGGGCSGTGPCTIIPENITAVTAVFEPDDGVARFILSVNTDLVACGDGVVFSTPAGIDCGSSCVASFPAGTSITLFGSPDAGEFTDWTEGPCAGSTDQSCMFTLDANTTATARFATRPLTFSDNALTDGNVGAEYTAFITTSGGFGSPDIFTLVAGSLPDGLIMDESFGVQSTLIHGVPTTEGTSTFTVQVQDQCDTATREFSITINGPTPVEITLPGPTAKSGVVGEFYFQNLFASGGQTPYEWSITGGQLPPGLGLVSAQNGNRIEGTPTAAGMFTFTLTVMDQLGQQASQETSITIN